MIMLKTLNEKYKMEKNDTFLLIFTKCHLDTSVCLIKLILDK